LRNTPHHTTHQSTTTQNHNQPSTKENMAPKKISTNPSPSAIPPSSTRATTVVPSAAGQPTRSTNKPATSSNSSSGQVRNAQDLQQIGAGVWNKYVDETPQRVKLLDAFLVFLIVVGVLQFVYCVIAGNFVSIHTYFSQSMGASGRKGRDGRKRLLLQAWGLILRNYYHLWLANNDISLFTAFQRFPLRLLGDCWPVCPHSQFAHADQPREQGGL
jgi:hypothetical protein